MKYSVAQAAKILNISKEAVYNRVRRNTLRSEKIGNRLYVFLDEVKKLPLENKKYDELKEKYLHLLAAYEALKLINSQIQPVKIEQDEWLPLKKYLKNFKKSKRKKVKKYLMIRLKTSKKIKIENDEIFIKNVKLKKIK